MFEPENDIERALVRASHEPSERPAFVRALMDAQIFVVLTADGGAIVPGANGTATVTEGATLKMESAERDGEKVLAFFTSPKRAQAWFPRDHIVAPETTRALFQRASDMPFVLNPGADYGKEFTREEVKHLLAGDFGDQPQTELITEPQQVLLAHPSERPDALIAALSREFSALDNVSAAWLLLAMRAGQPGQNWMLGVEHTGNWDNVRGAIGRAVQGGVLGDRLLDAMPLDGESFSMSLRGGIAIPLKKPGFFSKLFR
jgi:hypothetical protein